MKKRILPLLLSLVMLISLFPVEVMATEPEMTITAGTVEVTAGDTDVEIPISVVNAAPVMMMGLEFILPEGVTLKKMTAGEAATTAGASVKTNINAGTVNFEADNNITFPDGTILTLIVDVSSAASGSLTIQARPIDNNAGMIANEEEKIVPVTFVPGTITVKASTAERTVQFMNGTTGVETYTVANGGTLNSIPKAPTASADQSFLGWYAVSGTDYLLDSVNEPIIGAEASTQTAITADTTYQAIWASSAMLAAGFAPKDGKTEITGISQPGGLQTLVTNCNGGTVKLLQDVDIGSQSLVIAAESSLNLDLNGKTLSGRDCKRDSMGYPVIGPVIFNKGALTLYSSVNVKGTIKLTDTATSNWSDWGTVLNIATITRMENVRLEADAVCDQVWAYCGEDYNMDGEGIVLGDVINCEFVSNAGGAFYTYEGTSLGTIKDSTFVGKTSAITLSNIPVTAIENCTLTATEGTALKLTAGTTVASLTGGDITGANGIQVESYYGGPATAFGVLAPTSVEGTNGYALVVGGTITDNNKMTVNLTGGRYKGTEGALKLYTGATVTYPEGQKLLAGEDGWSTLQIGYSVTFLNADGSLLQQITCASGSSVTYTGEMPTRAADENYVYTFAHMWNTEADGNGTSYTDDTIANVTSDMTLYAQYTTASAKVVTVTIGSGAVGLADNYASLKAAVTALNAATGNYTNVVITLNEDAVETETVTIKKSVTLDLNGQTLTIDNSENGLVLDNGAKLTVKDSSEAGTGVYRHTADNVQKSAILASGSGSGTVVNIVNGTIEATKGSALTVDGAAFHVSGGTISGGQNGICVKTQNQSPDCTITGGKILCSGKGYALYMDESVAPYIKLSGGAFKNTFSNDGTYLIRYQDKCTFVGGKSLSPSPNTERFYEVREVGTYTFVLTADKKDYNYNAGETVTVTVSAYGPGSVNSFGFTPSYESDKLELKSVTSANDGNFTVNPKTGTSGYTVNDENGITLGNTSDAATPLVTITFTAKENVNNTTTITLKDLEMTPSGSATGDKTVVEKELTVNLHDLRVTLTAEHGAINDKKNVTLYAKYGENGLYSDAARKAPATVDVSADEGYRLNDKTGEKLWKCDNDGYTSFDDIKVLPFTESKAFDLQTTKVWTVSFNTTDMTGGSLSTNDPITVDDGTKLSAAGLPTATEKTGYAFTGWKVGTDNSTVDTNTYEVKADITLTPVFTVKSYDFTKVANQSTVTVTSGVGNNKATYGQKITFTVMPNEGYVVTDVRYTVGSGASTPLTANSGVYTIPGSMITGNVTVEVVTVKYVTVTFQAGTGNTLTGGGGAVAYAKSGVAGLYTDTTFMTQFTVPTPAAQEGYRLADQTGEALWKDGSGKGYTAETVNTAEFSANTTLTAQSVKTYKVTFVSAEPAKATVTGSQTLDADKMITEIPAATYTAGYTFKEWRIGETAYASDEALKAVAINGDTTVMLVAKDNSYTATLTGGNAADVTDITGISDGNATHGTPITFKLTAKDGYKVTKVAYKINGGDAVTISPSSEGVYTIPGDAIVGAVTLELTSNETVTVTFAAGANGAVGATAFVLDKGGKLTRDQLNAVTKTGNAGYTFKEWQINGEAKTDAELLDMLFNANTTVTAVFDHATYSVTADGISGVPDEATHGTSLTFTPTVNGEIVIGITVKIGETSVPVTKNTDGSYTIAGDAITGNLTITAQTVTGSWSFISKGGYKALSADTQIALLTTGQLASGNYLLDNQGMYWSSQYKAYVKIVNIKETAASLTAKLAFNASVAAQTLSYTGDINGSNTVTPADGGMINDELHSVKREYTLTEKERLEMDVNGNKKVSTEDIMSILRKYVGLE